MLHDTQNVSNKIMKFVEFSHSHYIKKEGQMKSFDKLKKKYLEKKHTQNISPVKVPHNGTILTSKKFT